MISQQKDKKENPQKIIPINSDLVSLLQELSKEFQNLLNYLESRGEVVKSAEVDKGSEWLKELYLEEIEEVKRKLKEIGFFKEIALDLAGK